MSAATIALAPFENLSGDPGHDYFVHGFVEDVATELSRFPTLEVLHPRSVSALLQDHAADSSRAPIAGHIVHGSVRHAGDVVRVSVQLVEAANGRQLWADRYDATAKDLLAVQDAIAARIARALTVHIDEARLGAARRAPLASLEVYDCWLRGLECLRRGSVEADGEARRFFERALEIDPAYARAYTGLSLSHFNEWSCQAWAKWDDKERLAYDYALRGLALDETDAMVQIVLARILVYRRRFDEAAHHVDRALMLNPNDTDMLVHAALCRGYLGNPESAIELANRAMRLNPVFPPWYGAPVGLGLFLLGRDAECLELVASSPTVLFVDTAAFAAAACALGGDQAGARAYLEAFLEIFQERICFERAPEPGEPLRWLLHVNPFRREEDAERLSRGLRLAGLDRDPDEGRPEARARSSGPGVKSATFRREGAHWAIAFDGLSLQLSHQKGFQDLVRLFRHPGQEIHCLDLTDRPADQGAESPVLDERARREIQLRVHDLQREIDEADALNDRGRAERAREEMDHIVELLSGAFGLQGRPRQLGSVAERARSAVTWRIRSAIKKIGGTHPRLGRHLDNAVRTGTFCSYVPETPTQWAL